MLLDVREPGSDICNVGFKLTDIRISGANWVDPVRFLMRTEGAIEVATLTIERPFIGDIVD